MLLGMHSHLVPYLREGKGRGDMRGQNGEAYPFLRCAEGLPLTQREEGRPRDAQHAEMKMLHTQPARAQEFRERNSIFMHGL